MPGTRYGDQKPKPHGGGDDEAYDAEDGNFVPDRRSVGVKDNGAGDKEGGDDEGVGQSVGVLVESA
jgi:hypothetical protein